MVRALIPALLLAAACTANSGDEGMFVVNNSALATGTTTCSFTGALDQPFITSGEVYSGSPFGYEMTPLIESRIAEVMGLDTQKTITIEGAHVTLTAPGVTFTTPKFDAYFAATLPPASSINAGFELLPVQALQDITAAGSAANDIQVLANVVPFGTLGGSRIDGSPFQYPVTVGSNLVVNMLGDCTALASGTVPRAGNPCNVYQDGIVDCCTKGATLVCPAPMPM